MRWLVENEIPPCCHDYEKDGGMYILNDWKKMTRKPPNDVV